MLGRAETGPGFCLINVSGLLMAAGRLKMHCGFFSQWMVVGGLQTGMFLGWVCSPGRFSIVVAGWWGNF